MTLSDILSEAADAFIDGVGKHIEETRDIVDVPVGIEMPDGTVVMVKSVVMRKKTTKDVWSDGSFVVILSGK